MVSPDSQAIACPLSGRNSTYRPVQISGTGSDTIPSFVALGRQVAANEPQLTPEQEVARRRILAAAQIPLENPDKASAAE
jgi:hypothetical protein